MALLKVLETSDDLDELVDAFVWAHEQTRRHNPTTDRGDRVVDVARVLMDACERDALAIVAAELLDRLTDALRREAGWERLP